MKRKKLLNRRILALALSAAMIFAQADIYSVLAAATESPGETVEYGNSDAALTEMLEVEELGTEEAEIETESETGNGSSEAEGNGITDEQASGEGADSLGNTDSGITDSVTTDSGISGTTDSSTSDTTESGAADSDAADGENSKAESSGGTEETGENEKAEEAELPTGDASEGETETGSGDGDGTKEVISISGVTIEDKNYDGASIAYTGTPVIKDAAENTITSVTPTASYAGTLADGTPYAQSAQAPSQAGNYTLSFVLAENDNYILSQASYPFSIKPATLTITAPSLTIKTGEALPELSAHPAKTEGLLNGDTLTTQPQLKYADNIPTNTNTGGTYDIIASGADAGNNYEINYVKGTLAIETAGGTSGEEPGKEPGKDAEIVHEGTSKNKKLTWAIDSNGKLTVKGSGNYPTQYEEDYGINVPEWYVWCDEIKSAEINVSGITTTEGMFFGCSKLKSIDLANLNTSKVKNMYNMFGGCYALETLDLSTFNTGSVTDMCNMFSDCGVETLDLSTFNTGSVTSMEGMFEGCSSLKSLDLSSFNTSKVKSMSEMFAWCNNLESLDLSSFNTSQTVSMSYMFQGCRSLKKLDLSNFNTAKVSQMGQMFDRCESLESVDLSSFNTKNASNMSGMFSDCKSLERLDLSNFNTGKTVDLMDMFSGCSSLVSLDLSSFDTRKVQYVIDMFKGCSSLTSVDLSSFDLKLFDKEDEDVSIPIFDGCDSLSYIRTPKSCALYIPLPKGASGRDAWYSALNTPCNAIPTGLSSSVELYKNGYPGDANGTKKFVSISGVRISSRVYNGQSIKYFGTPVAKDSAGNKITDVTLTYSYTGTLADGSAYAQTTDAPSSAGTYKLLIKAEGSDCSGQESYSFRITPKTLTVSAPSLSIDKGAALPDLAKETCTISGLLDGDTLTSIPTLTYSESNISTVSAGRYGIIPSGASAGNNYDIEYKEGTLTVGDPDDDSSFDEPDRALLNPDTNPSLKCTIANIKAKVYDGSAYEPAVKVTVTDEKGKKKTLTEGTDYRVLYENNVNAGDGKVIIRGSGIYKGEASKTFKINQKPVKKLKVMAGGVNVDSESKINADAVNSGAISLPICVYDAGKLLTRDKDYTVAYDGFKKGTLTVKVTGKEGSNYTGEAKAKITVYAGVDAAHIINPDNVGLNSYTEKYTGKALKPLVEVNIGGETIAAKNYKVQYQNNKNAGTAYVIVTGKGAYKGKVVKEFEITANTQRLSITNTIKAQTYNGKLIKPSVTVKAGNKKLKKNTDYTIAYKNNFHAGTATVTVTGKGNYTGTAIQTFIINPLKAAKITVKGVWKDNDGDSKKDGGALTVTQGKRSLKEGKDYTLEPDESSIKNNKIKVTLKAAEGSDFTGSVVKTLKME